MAVYGNMIHSINENSKKGSTNILCESLIEDTTNSNFFLESVTIATISDDMSLLEYCSNFMETEVVSESVKDVITSVGKFIRDLLERLKKFVTEQFNKAKEFFRKKSFRTDKKGEVKSETANESYIFEASGKYDSLYDLAGEELSKEISVPTFNRKISQNWIVTMSRDIYYSTNQIKEAIDGVFRYDDPKDIEDCKQQFEQSKKSIEQCANPHNGYGCSYSKKSKLTRDEIKEIINGSELSEKEVLGEMRKVTDDCQKWIGATQNRINERTIRSGSTNMKDENGNEMQMSDNAYEQFVKYATTIIETADKTVYQLTTTYMQQGFKYISMCSTARRELEAELFMKRRAA